MKKSGIAWRSTGVLGGLGVLGWTLVFPFYGPLAGKLLQEQAPLGTHSFVLGLAVGYVLCAWRGKHRSFRADFSSLAAVTLAVASWLSPWIYLTTVLMALSGMATAGPTLTWTSFLASTERRVFPFIVAVIGANLLCYVATLTASNPVWAYALAALAAVSFLLGSRALEGEATDVAEDAPQRWIVLWPLLLFIISASYVGGLLYGAIIPAVQGWAGLGWLSFWPYILAFILAGILASRRYEVLPAATLSIYGLALLPLALLQPGQVVLPWILSFISIMIGAAFADTFIWLALIYLASRGHSRVIAIGLALNVGTIWTVSVLSDLAVLRSPDRMPTASVLSAALLFVLIPVIISRFSPSQRGFSETADGQSPDSVSILEQVSRPDVLATLTEAETRVCELLLAGNTNRDIAGSLFISINTVKYHVRNILRKSGCANRKELIDEFLPNGIDNTVHVLPARSLDR